MFLIKQSQLALAFDIKYLHTITRQINEFIIV